MLNKHGEDTSLSLGCFFNFNYMAKGYKTGGRQKGTPNKENPLKEYLRVHSLAYFEPKEQQDEDGNKYIASDFDVDMAMLAPDDRVSAELRLLEFHTPKMKAVDIDLDAKVSPKTIEDLLSDLCLEDEDE